MIFEKKVSLLLLLVMLMACSLSAQNGTTYRIDRTGDYNQALLEKALDGANLDAYRRLETDRILTFDQDAEVTLFPARHLEASGIPVKLEYAIPEASEIDPNRIFMVHPSGMLMEAISAAPVKK